MNTKISDESRHEVSVFVGGTSGIGRAMAIEVARPDAQILIVGRNEEAARSVVGACTAKGAEASFLLGDLSVLSEVKRVSASVRDRVDHIDLLVHSADVILPDLRLTPDGLETQFVTNYLSRFVINAMLFDRLAAGRRAHIIHVAAPGSPGKLDAESFPPRMGGVAAHTLGQQANDLYAITMVEQLKGTGVVLHAINPGIVETGIRRQMRPQWLIRIVEALMSPITISPAKAAQRILRLRGETPTSPEEVLYGMRGFRPMKPATKFLDKDIQVALWNASEQLTRTTFKRGA